MTNKLRPASLLLLWLAAPMSGWHLHLRSARGLRDSRSERGPAPAGAAAQQREPGAGAPLERAQAALEARRLGEALEQCLLAIHQNPKSAPAYSVLGEIQRRSGHPDQAKAAWQRAAQLSPANPSIRLALGQLALDTGDFAAATRAYQSALKLGDADGRARYGLGLALLGESKPQEALPLVSAASAVSPNDAERIFTLATIRLQLHQRPEALKSLIRLESLSAQDPWALSRIGKMLLGQGLSREAEMNFERAAALVESGRAAAPPDLRLADLELQIAQLRFDRSDYAGAIEYLDKVQPGSEGQEVEAARLDLLGASLLALGDPGGARAKQSAALQLAPCDPNYIAHLAWSELLDGDLAAAGAAAQGARARWPNDPNVTQISAILARESLPERKRVAFARDWHLKGEGMVCCPCDTPCPCRSNAPPTHGHCESSGAFHITQGHYGAVALDGATFAVVSSSMDTQSVPAVFYVDSAASADQVTALEHLFQGFIPLHQFVALDVRRTPLSFAGGSAGTQPGVYEVVVPGVLQMKIERQLNRAGEPLLRTAALDYFSNTIEYARNLIYRVTDPQAGLKWDYSGRQANYRIIDLDAQDYRQARMLIQFGDVSGSFTEKQLELIRSQKLPTLPGDSRGKAGNGEVRKPSASGRSRRASGGTPQQ